jgi:hypothetical protein
MLQYTQNLFEHDRVYFVYKRHSTQEWILDWVPGYNKLITKN